MFKQVMEKSARRQRSEFLGLADDTFVRHDDLIYGDSGLIEHRVTFTARPPAPKIKQPSSGES